MPPPPEQFTASLDLTLYEAEFLIGGFTPVPGPPGPTGPTGPAGPGVPTGGTTGQVLTKDTVTDFDTSWQTPSGGASLTALHSALLGVKVWDTGSSAYVWSGDGTAPDANAWTSILFVDPTGAHDPATSTGGRNNANDLWETGDPTSTVGSLPATQQTGTTYTFVLTDASTVVEGNNASAQTFTIPLNASVAYPLGTLIEVYQMGAGQITIAATGGVTLRIPNGAKTAHQYSTIQLRKRATDEWVLSGDSTT